MNKLLASFSNQYIEAGCDEAGRGCLAGPVVAAAVILPEDFDHDDLNDSKQLSEKKRNEIRLYIEEHALAYAVEIVSEKEIDTINILNASLIGMKRAADRLKITPELLLIDGNRFHKHESIPHECIIKGDGKYKSIAAASILAKTYRDEIMEKLDLEFPIYQWKKNKGYPTKAHRIAILQHGSCKYHRESFKLIPDNQLSLFD